MASHLIHSLAVAQESSFGDLDTDHLPTVGGEVAIGVQRAAFFEAYEEPNNAMDLTRGGAYEYAPEPETVINRTGAAKFGAADGEAIRRLSGDITLRARLNNLGVGTAYASHGAHPFFQLLESSCGVIEPPAASDVVASLATDVNEFEPTSVADYNLGQVVAVVRNNAVEYATVTQIDDTPAAELITVSPGFSSVLAKDEAIIHCTTFYPLLGATMSPVRLRADMAGARLYACGCRMTKLALSFEGETLVADVTMHPAVVLRDDSNAAVEGWTPSDGVPAQWLQSYHLISSTAVAGLTAPAKLTRQALALHEWSAEIDFPLSATPAPHTILGASNQDVMDAPLTLTLGSEPDATLADMLRLREERQIVLGCGPAGAGQGAVLCVQAAHLAEGSMLGEGEEGRQQQAVSMRPGQWALDDGATDGANTSWRLAFPMPPAP